MTGKSRQARCSRQVHGNREGEPQPVAGAVRRGDWKLVEWLEDGRVELFNLANDLGEAKDLAAQEPDRVARMRDELHAWQRQVGAKFPIPNPKYDPARPSGRATGRPGGAEALVASP